MEKETREIARVFLEDYSVQSRLKGVGVISKEKIHELGAVGPMMRASGSKTDTRKMGYAAYGKLDFEPVTSEEGDSYARVDVRIQEIFQSMDLIRQAVDILPEGEIAAPVKGNPKGEYFMRVEQPRGEALYYVKANGSRFLDRVRVRTPTFANVPAMLEILKDCQLADVPILILTIDPCISCTER
jgi:ech hydrogenase subunit E